MAIASEAWKRTAASRSFSSSISGISRWRTTIWEFEIAEADALGKVVGLEHVLERVGERRGVADLAVGRHPGELMARQAAHRVAVDLHGREEAAVDIETDGRARSALLGAEREGRPSLYRPRVDGEP